MTAKCNVNSYLLLWQITEQGLNDYTVKLHHICDIFQTITSNQFPEENK